ncbi:unnamed protein product [Paramecium octaurelia]|uniref:Histidine kinase/HSP90-like ATPase domain-containing protein n=1 Tax=Paramecium octaurelia TaxID=43137 RepID=A0A8S1VSW2_PAROT|nr:unnamed protein product [Paramecium octaurelia]
MIYRILQFQRMISKILRINSSKVQICFYMKSLYKLIKKVEEGQLDRNLNDEGYYFKSKPMSLLTQIRTDYQRLLQVLNNIIQNALTYSETGFVLVKIDSWDLNEIEFSIKMKEQLTSIRQIINQKHTTTSIQQQGFGLIICQILLKYLSLINRNRIKIESDGQDSGTTVHFIISIHISTQTQEQTYGQHSKKSFPRMRITNQYQIKISKQNSTEQVECDLSSVSFREIL